MNLSQLKDAELLLNIKNLAHQERQVLTQVLGHLREVERRKLFSELKYKSLFEYCLKELKYSEGQAGRRIQAMRLLKEIPELESKVQMGTLTLTHLSQAQSYFREKAKHTPVPREEKSHILSQLENKTSRETEKILIALSPELALPVEKERVLDDIHTEIKFVMDGDLKETLTEVRALLGAKALNMNYAELIQEMANLSVVALRTKKFGKKRTADWSSWPIQNNAALTETLPPAKTADTTSLKGAACSDKAHSIRKPRSPKNAIYQQSHGTTPAPELRKNTKAISKSIKHQIWLRDQGKCTRCLSSSQLNIDHVHPKALGGDNSLENLRLLCFHCNQRRAMKTYGIRNRIARTGVD